MNNRNTAGKIQLMFTLLVLLFTALFICSLVIPELAMMWLQLSSGILMGVVLYLFMYGGYYYFDIEKQDGHFFIKFYNTFPFSREFKMFQVPISSFIKYEIEGSEFYRRKLLLFQMSSSQMAKYPPIFISAFSAQDNIAFKSFFASLK